MLQGREPVEPPMFSRVPIQPQQTQQGLNPQALMALIQRLQTPQPQTAGAQPRQGGLANLMAAKGQQQQPPQQPGGGMFTGGVAP